MIYVALGTHERPFYRLVKELERLIKNGKIGERVVVQLGFTDYKVEGAENYQFIEEGKMESFIKKCDIMITHGGLGSIMRGIRAGKPVIAVPRRKVFNEHSDDHQLQIVEETKKIGSVMPVYDIEDLLQSIKKAKKMKVKKLKTQPKPKVFKIIDLKLKEWNERKVSNLKRLLMFISITLIVFFIGGFALFNERFVSEESVTTFFDILSDPKTASYYLKTDVFSKNHEFVAINFLRSNGIEHRVCYRVFPERLEKVSSCPNDLVITMDEHTIGSIIGASFNPYQVLFSESLTGHLRIEGLTFNDILAVILK